MAKTDLTPLQENCSILFFKTLLKAKFNLSDAGYAELDKEAFQKPGGLYPLTNSKKDREWKRSFDEQVLGLGTYMVSRSIPTTGWVWSRGTGMMKYLENVCTKRCGSTVKAWNPMDIVAVVKTKDAKIKAEIEKYTNTGDEKVNMNMLNNIMRQAILDKELMPISLKKVGANERGGFELSKTLKGRNARLKSIHYFKAVDFLCDLEWSIDKNEWKNAQEVSWNMIETGSKPYGVKVQGRTFSAKSPRENPQHSGAEIEATGAHLGKAAVGEIKKYLKSCGLTEVPSPGKHPQIPSPGNEWTPVMKKYWITLYNKLSQAKIEGQKINFNNPGVYAESMTPIEKGFEAALNSASQADFKQEKTIGGRSSGSRLTAKLWAMEYLDRYYEMSKRNKFESFMHVLVEAMKKEESSAFIKIYGQTGRGKSRYKV